MKTLQDASEKGLEFPGSFRLRQAPTGDRAKTDGVKFPKSTNSVVRAHEYAFQSEHADN